jgi:hypothetical protein
LDTSVTYKKTLNSSAENGGQDFTIYFKGRSTGRKTITVNHEDKETHEIVNDSEHKADEYKDAMALVSEEIRSNYGKKTTSK